MQTAQEIYVRKYDDKAIPTRSTTNTYTYIINIYMYSAVC